MLLQTPEFTVSVAVLAVVLLAVNLLLVYLSSPWSSGGRHRETESDAETRRRRTGRADRSTTAETDTDLVRCPDCGTENDPQYRYCRWCVSELPVGLAADDDGPPTVGQVLR